MSRGVAFPHLACTVSPLWPGGAMACGFVILCLPPGTQGRTSSHLRDSIPVLSGDLVALLILVAP